MGGKLTKRFVETAGPGRHGDGDGLWLDVSPSGARSWLLRYQIGGRIRNMGLGSTKLVGLADARERARLARLKLLDGVDPLDERRTQRAKLESVPTFAECARQVIDARAAGLHRESLRQWRASMVQADRVFGSLPVAEIDTALVLKAVEPVWARTQVTGDRLRQRIEAVLDWARARGYRAGDNPARWRGHLQYVLRGDAAVEHHAALPYAEMPAFMKALRSRDGVAARALEFAILTACRSGEILGARWDEIEGDVWTVPAERMKARKAHTVPLSKAAMALLAAQPRAGEFIFAGLRPGAPLERHAMADLLKAMGAATTVHGFRSSFRDWASECTSHPPAVCELALAHSIPGKVERAYRRGDLLEKRRRLMEAWAEFCASPAHAGGEVVRLRGRSA